MTCYVFPGQGSQKKGMGQNVFSYFPKMVNLANEILGYDIAYICKYDPYDKLHYTQYAQPAIYLVNALNYFMKLEDTNNKIDISYVVGHSLGEYNALLAAQVIDFKTGLKIVKKRAEIMSESANGCMLAVIGLNIEQIRYVIDEYHINGVEIANHNSYTQIVIAGLKHNIEHAQKIFEKINKSIVTIPLKVEGAFHSSYMNQARTKFNKFLEDFTFDSPKISVISNYTGKPYSNFDIKYNLVQHITNPVLWVDSIEYIISKKEEDFKEIGDGKVLKKLIDNIKKVI